jgi:acyl transferase domain-containing protein/thioesterase domain-containing protein
VSAEGHSPNGNGCDAGGRIAVVGIGLRFPGAHGAAQFWSNLRGGVESIRALDDEELAARGVPERLLRDPAYVKRARVLEEFDHFDAEFFGFSPKDAAILDPQHRLFMEVCWEALEDAGHVPGRFKGPIGVYAGCGFEAYFALNLLNNPELVGSTGLFLLRHTGNDKDFLTTRVSYCLDLRGPSVSIQTACSTSLVAVHHACQSLSVGECDMALAGGVSIEIPHGLGYLHTAGEILSPDGRCRPFDAEANGTVFGSGAGVVILRRLEDALADGDRIYAVIRGSAVNNDGSGKVGYLAPSVDGQAAVVAEALEAASVDPDTIDYIETHGSGTPIGEPIEVAALTRVFQRSSSRRHFCGLGSLKPNVGHLDTAAGVAGLIKVALALHHDELPPTPNFRVPNPAIPFGDTPFFIVDRLRPWPRGQHPRRAGVTSLGIGGTNAHVVLEEAPETPRVGASGREWQLLGLSARSPAALDEAGRRLARHLRDNAHLSLADVAWTLHAGRREFEHRRVLSARTREEAAALLESGDPQHVFTHRASADPAPVVALLPGGGSQHARMGLDLYAAEPVFRAQVERGLEAFRQRTGRDLRPVWVAPFDPQRAEQEFQRPSIQLPALFILEHALAQLWASFGLRFEALVGHSLGENTAACLAGVMSFEDTLGLVALRGELFEQTPPGAMLSVTLGPEELASVIGPDLDVAAVNSPGISVVSGPPDAIESLAQRLTAGGIESRRVPIATAAHSRLIEPILPRFLEYLRGITLHAPSVPILSNRTGTWLTPEQAVRPEYWVEHLRHTVRFGEGLAVALAEPGRVLLEVGPGKTLSSLARQQPAAAGARAVIASMRHADEQLSDVEHLLTAVGRVWAAGADVDVGRLWKGERRVRVTLPTYPFERRRYWIDPARPAPAAPETAPVPAEAVAPRRLDPLAEGLSRPVWRERPPPPAAGAEAPPTWLLFLDAAGVGARLARRLRSEGHEVVTVRESDDNRRLAPDDYALAPERGREGYDLLVNDLLAAGRTPQRIVHLWLLTPDESFRPGSNFFHHTQERGFYSLFFLAQALGDRGAAVPLHLTVAGNGLAALDGERLLHPSKATVLGPCRVIPREFADVTCTVVDLPLPVSRTRGAWRTAKTARHDELAELLGRELAGPPRCAFAAWRDGRRYEQEFERVALPAAADGHTGLRPRGVYLITGGLSGLGLVVARHLARQVQARLVLLARSPLPAREDWDAWLRRADADDRTRRRLRAVRELESLGAEVLPVSADVTDVEAVRAALDEAGRRFGPLNGVFHAAGVLKDGPLLGKSQAEIEEVFAPKVHGTLVLDALLADSGLDFLLLFSSLGSFVAPAGQVDYVAANAFLDAYAQSGRIEHTLVVNWGIWNGTGMASDALGAETALPVRGSARHPLFESRDGGPGTAVVLEARLSADRQWLLDEHRSLEGHAVVPGSALIEMAGAAVAETSPGRGFELRDLLLYSPLCVFGGETRPFQVELRPDAEDWSFRVRSRSGARQSWETHAEARLVMRPRSAPGRLPLAALEARCRPARVAGQGQSLAPVQEGRMRFGPRWHALREVRVGHGEVLVTLELGAAFAADLERYRLHPALLDLALTCGLELPELGAWNGLWVPVSWRSVRVHAALPARVRAWARLEPVDHESASVLTFEVTVADEQGQVLVEAEGFALRQLPISTAFGAPAPAPARASAQPPVPEVRAQELGPPAPAQSNGAHHDWSPGRAALRRNYEQGLTPTEGLAVLCRLLAAGAPSPLLATSLDFEGLRRQAVALAVQPVPGPLPPVGEDDGDDDLGAPDSIERTLAGFWRELLGARRVGVHDSFFDLGGHSLVAVRLFARIRKAFDVDFPISLLFEAPTIARCADAIRRARGVSVAGGPPAPVLERAHRHLVPLHPGQGGDVPPFFLVAGMFGNVLNLRHLAHLLGHERPVYGLQAQGLYGTHQPHETVEEMAAAYIAELRSVHPHGPFLLGGFSGGGITAFEMARQLLAAGDEVSQLVMLDTYLPHRPVLTASDRARIHWDRLLARGPAYATEWLRDRLRWEIAKIRKAREHDAPLPSEFRSEAVGEAFRRAVGRYDLEPYAGRIMLFRPKLEIAHVLGPGRVTNAKRVFLYHDNGWGPYCAGVDVHEVPGDHDSMVLEPHVRVLAGRLRRCIESLEPTPEPLAVLRHARH